MKKGKLLLSGLLVWIFNTGLIFVTCGWLFRWVYELPPNIWLDEQTMMSPMFLTGSNLVGLFSAMLFVLVYALFYKGIPGKGVRKGLTYGLATFLIGPLAGFLAMPFFMTISKAVIIYWIIQAFAAYLVKGAIVGLVYKEKR